MLPFTNTRKTRHVAIVAALLTFATTGVALARQDGTFPSLPPAQNGGSTQNLQSVIARATQFHQAARLRQNVAPTGARTSYSAASQAFGDLLTSLGSTAPVAGVTDGAQGGMMPSMSSEQAASDVRALRSAARKAGSPADADRLNKAAALYATGAKEFLTGQLREALLETTAQPVVLRGDPRAADAAARKANQPPVAPPKTPDPPKVPKTPPPPNPNPPVPPDPSQDPNTPPNNPPLPPPDPSVPQQNPPGNPTLPIPPPAPPTPPQNPPQ